MVNFRLFILICFLPISVCRGISIRKIINEYLLIQVMEHNDESLVMIFSTVYSIKNIYFNTFNKYGYKFCIPFVLHKYKGFDESWRHIAQKNKFFYDFTEKDLLPTPQEYFSSKKNIPFLLSDKRRDLIYRLENPDGTAWNQALSKLPRLVDVSEKIISKCHDREKRIHARNFSSFDAVQKIIKENSSLLDERYLTILNGSLEAYSQEEKTLLNAYKNYELPKLKLDRGKSYTFDDLALYYAAELPDSIIGLIPLIDKWLKYNYFTQKIIQNSCSLLRGNSYKKNHLLIINPLLLFLNQLLQSPYKNMFILDPLKISREPFLADFIYCLFSFISQCINNEETKKSHADALIQCIINYYIDLPKNEKNSPDNYYNQIKLLCDKDKNKKILFKPLIQKHILRNYIKKILLQPNSPFKKTLATNLTLASYIAEYWEPTETFIEDIKKSKNKTTYFNYVMAKIKNILTNSYYVLYTIY